MKNRSIFSSVKCAIRGLCSVFKTERNCIFYLCNIILFGALNYLFLNCNVCNWTIYFISIVGVFSSECINTAIERICDFITENKNDKIKSIKDISAGAVLCWGILFYINEIVVIWAYIH